MSDVLVIGAGPAGTSYALAAARAGANVLIAAPRPRHRPYALELLSGRAWPTIERLGVAALVTETTAPCAGVVGRWGSSTIDRSTILEPHGIGWIVDRSTLDIRLLEAAMSAGCAHAESVVDCVEPAGRGWRARAGGAWLYGDRVVLATGRVSRLVSRCGVPRSMPHQLVAIVGWVSSSLPDLGDRLYVADASDGWWYGIGRGPGTSLGFCTDLDLLGPGPRRPAISWAHALEHFGWPPAEYVRPSLRLAFTGVLDGPVPDRMQLVGDAALALDPLSGHGLTIALESALRAVTDPSGYPAWLAEVTATHLVQQRKVYSAAGQKGHFWERRA